MFINVKFVLSLCLLLLSLCCFHFKTGIQQLWGFKGTFLYDGILGTNPSDRFCDPLTRHLESTDQPRIIDIRINQFSCLQIHYYIGHDEVQVGLFMIV